MKKIFMTFLIVVCLSIPAFNNAVHAATVPTISIIGVTEGEKVALKTNNFPANKDFEARMGLIGTKGVNGILVGTFNSGAGGSMLINLMIPAALESENLIAVRLESTTGSYYAYNWFTNVTFGTHEGSVPVTDVVSIPTISILTKR